HPHHKHFVIFNKIFQYVNSPKFENMNMGEFSNWWSERNKLEPEFQYINKKIIAKYNSNIVFVRISTKNGFIISQKGDVQVDEITLKPHIKQIIKHDLKRIRKFHWRDLLYDYETKKNKKHFL
ncbi:MAG: hypothetical protein U9P73_09785, partial [Candidatus Cloacimonadota bacterium]|nr:hypothetical protein [Candidatus Cloacimonadota bacterium]